MALPMSHLERRRDQRCLQVTGLPGLDLLGGQYGALREGVHGILGFVEWCPISEFCVVSAVHC